MQYNGNPINFILKRFELLIFYIYSNNNIGTFLYKNTG